MISEQLYLYFKRLPSLLLLKMLYACMLKDPFNGQITVHNSLCTSIHCHIASLKKISGKHSTILCMRLFSLCKCGVTNENNWSHLKNNRYIGENNRANFLELQNRIIGKIKSIIGSGLIVTLLLLCGLVVFSANVIHCMALTCSMMLPQMMLHYTFIGMSGQVMLVYCQ